MTHKSRRRVLAAVGGALTVGLAGCASGGNGGGDGEATEGEMTSEGGMDGEMTSEGGMEETETDTGGMGNAMVRVSHMAPDAPNVDVYVDGDAVLEDVPFKTTSDYLDLPAGTYTVEVTAAGDPDTSVFEGDVTVEGDTAYTIAAWGELADDGEEFQVTPLVDDVSDPGGDSARVRLVHLSPDAPAVDVTVNATGDAIFDGVAYGDTANATVPANDYTLQIRGDTEENDGEIVADYDVSLNGGTVYTAFAAGYLSPDDEPVDESFDLVVEQDASY